MESRDELTRGPSCTNSYLTIGGTGSYTQPDYPSPTKSSLSLHAVTNPWHNPKSQATEPTKGYKSLRLADLDQRHLLQTTKRSHDTFFCASGAATGRDLSASESSRFRLAWVCCGFPQSCHIVPKIYAKHNTAPNPTSKFLKQSHSGLKSSNPTFRAVHWGHKSFSLLNELSFWNYNTSPTLLNQQRPPNIVVYRWSL